MIYGIYVRTYEIISTLKNIDYNKLLESNAYYQVYCELNVSNLINDCDLLRMLLEKENIDISQIVNDLKSFFTKNFTNKKLHNRVKSHGRYGGMYKRLIKVLEKLHHYIGCVGLQNNLVIINEYEKDWRFNQEDVYYKLSEINECIYFIQERIQSKDLKEEYIEIDYSNILRYYLYKIIENSIDIVNFYDKQIKNKGLVSFTEKELVIF